MPVNISTAIITKNNNKVRLANLTSKQGSAVQSPASTIKSSDICATAIKTYNQKQLTLLAANLPKTITADYFGKLLVCFCYLAHFR